MTNSKSPARSLSLFLLIMINLATILSIKNWPIYAESGLSAFFFLIVGFIGFFLPCSFVAAELATTWPERGGIFVWVKEAFGKNWGFLSVWLLWVENVVFFPSILSFFAGTIAYSINPSLASNPVYTYCVILAAFWGCTLVNIRGMKSSGWMSTLFVVIGTFIPGLLIILLGGHWVTSGNPTVLSWEWSKFIPDLSSPAQLGIMSGVILSLAGMEMPAVHARDVINPQKNYPKAIAISALIIIILSVLGTLAIEFVIPAKNINLLSGVIEAISYFLNQYGLGWLIPSLAFLVALGALGGVTTWIAGPSKGLLAAAQSGELPSYFHKMNSKGMPTRLLVLQGIIVTILSLVYLIFPHVNSSFWILLILSSQLYCIMYVMMFVSALVLRYKQPEKKRPYSVPGKTIGLWIMCSLGIITSVFSIFIGFFPPENISFGSYSFYFGFLFFGIIIFCILPFLILLFKNKQWDKNPL